MTTRKLEGQTHRLRAARGSGVLERQQLSPVRRSEAPKPACREQAPSPLALAPGPSFPLRTAETVSILQPSGHRCIYSDGQVVDSGRGGAISLVWHPLVQSW